MLGEDLDGHLSFRLLMVAEVDRSHAALTETAEDVELAERSRFRSRSHRDRRAGYGCMPGVVGPWGTGLFAVARGAVHVGLEGSANWERPRLGRGIWVEVSRIQGDNRLSGRSVTRRGRAIVRLARRKTARRQTGDRQGLG